MMSIQCIHGAMKFCKLPYGEPVYFTGQYEEDEGYPLYVQSLVCDFKLKPGCVPSIQIKNNFHYSETEYLRESEVETVLTLTSVDLKLFFDNYDVTVYSWKVDINLKVWSVCSLTISIIGMSRKRRKENRK